MVTVSMKDLARLRNIAELALERWEDVESSWATELAIGKQDENKKLSAIKRKVNRYRKEIAELSFFKKRR